MSISFTPIIHTKPAVQLATTTTSAPYKLQNDQVLQICQLKKYQNMVSGEGSLADLKVVATMVGQGAVLESVYKQLNYDDKMQQKYNLDYMANDLDTLDRADAFMKTPLPATVSTNGTCLPTLLLLKRAYCIQDTSTSRMIGGKDRCEDTRQNSVDFKTLMNECP